MLLVRTAAIDTVLALQEWQPVVDPFSTLLPYSHFDASSFQTAEYINYLVRTDPHDVERITSLPMRGADEEEGEEGEPEVEADCWVYEQLRCALRKFTATFSKIWS